MPESIRLDTEKERQTHPSAEANKSNRDDPDFPDGPEKFRIEDTMKSFPPQKDDKTLVNVGVEQKIDNVQNPEQPVAFLLSAISETGLVSILSVLTAVLLQANSRLSSEQVSELPDVNKLHEL